MAGLALTDRAAALDVLLRARIVAILRLEHGEQARPVVEALHAGGIRCVEVSLTTPGALAAITEIRERVPEVLVGVGTVCDAAEAAEAIAAGARFVVTPITATGIVEESHRREVPVAMGALTPTEMFVAHRSGADLIKLFPASAVDPGYIGAVRGPFPRLRLMPTGGIDVLNARKWIDAGADVLGVGGGVADRHAVADRRWEAVTEAARALVAAIRPGGPPESLRVT